MYGVTKIADLKSAGLPKQPRKFLEPRNPNGLATLEQPRYVISHTIDEEEERTP